MRNFNNNRSGGNRRFDRGGRSQMHDTVCDECGKDCQVPFMPSNGKPVYCSDCFEAKGNGRRDDRRSDRRGSSNDRPQKNYDQQFQVLNDKLDQILEALSSQADSIILEEDTKPKKAKKTKEVIDEIVEAPVATEETQPEAEATAEIVDTVEVETK